MAGFNIDDLNSHHLPAFLLHLREIGIVEPRLLKAIEKTDRRHYIPDLSTDEMWLDRDHAIGFGQNAGSLSIVATMLNALAPQSHHKVLDVGFGCGYQTALLARLSRRVYGLERVRPLTRLAEKNLWNDGLRNVTLFSDDGHKGWPAQAPFDAIVVTAACEAVPSALLDQLSEGGRLVAPIDEGHGEEAITLFLKSDEGITSKIIGRGEFPPLVPGRVSDD
ncbi:MAG: protein-L-isoaspartate(D-aspartate) O-methyltransferase [Hyphomicrobiales bacterium]